LAPGFELLGLNLLKGLMVLGFIRGRYGETERERESERDGEIEGGMERETPQEGDVYR
jgi:hypothetical protein